jgi:phosphoenolpyruvate carboxykinase (GTP)
MKTNPNMMRTLKKGAFYPTLFTNTALNTDTNEPWWDGIDGAVPENLSDWQGKGWNISLGTKAAHPNSRFTVSIYNAPMLSKEFDNPKGVPISAIIFGGRRTHLVPLTVESFNWQHGVFLGARMGSETTAAAAHRIGVLRRDPMAMLPFCGYNMGDYFRHWLSMGKKLTKPPKIFTVNWFRIDEDREFIWPGFGDNIRILEWMVDRVNGKSGAKEASIGFVPRVSDLNLEGLNISKQKLEKILDINLSDWKQEIIDIKNFLSQFGYRLPPEILQEYDRLANKVI